MDKWTIDHEARLSVLELLVQHLLVREYPDEAALRRFGERTLEQFIARAERRTDEALTMPLRLAWEKILEDTVELHRYRAGRR